jgi:predicted GNAT family acetyltransferase
MNEEPQVKIRTYQPDDFNFVVNSWLNSSHELFPARKINKKYYNKMQTPLFASIIGTSNILVACNSEDPNHIFGYVVFERLGNEVIVHFIYVKKELRTFGIARQMIESGIPEWGKQAIAITSMPNLQKTTEDEERVDVMRKWNLVYDPYILNRRVNL